MRNLIILLLIAVLASCSNSNFSKRKYTKGNFKIKKERYRTVSSDKEEKAVYLENLSHSESTTENEVSEDPVEVVETTTADLSDDLNLVEEVTIEEENFLETLIYEAPAQVQDTVYVGEFEKERARKAQNQGTASLFLALGGFFFLSVFLLGLIALIISIILGAKSLKSQYNTRKGVNRAKFGVIFSSIVIFLGIVSIILLITFLFLLF